MKQVRPAVIVALGATALRAIVGRKVDMGKAIGAPIRLGNVWVLVTWHPSYALRVGDAIGRKDVAGAIADTVGRADLLAMTAEDI
ncbi:uracil-DNA glycosylase family protein [Cupriavidus respiraculi]|uniref:uracil-DNA glycosylase family protein n=1 Tax=Cupriavidus respiraculi TaxID=195930 RepID=UPI001CC71E77|nr:uracil-DNA glycosylase family protein [Cupriavidus respiraculi]